MKNQRNSFKPSLLATASLVTAIAACASANASTMVDVSTWSNQYNDTGSGVAVTGAPNATGSFSTAPTGFYYDWNAGGTVGGNTGSNVFSAYFTGGIYAASAGTYSLTLNSDDASYLFINGGAAPVISDGGAHGDTPVTGLVSLAAGYNSFTIEYGNIYACCATTSLITNSVGATIGGVPEASTWAMMLVGFAGVGFASYRQMKRNGASAVAAG